MNKDKKQNYHTIDNVCPGSRDQFYISSYYIKWVKTFWTSGKITFQICQQQYSLENFTSCQGWEYRRGRGGVSQQGQVEVSGRQGQVRQVRQEAVCEPAQTKGKVIFREKQVTAELLGKVKRHGQTRQVRKQAVSEPAQTNCTFQKVTTEISGVARLTSG